MTPRVSLDGEIILDLILDNSALGPDKSVAGVTVPTFVQRTVTTRLRLRDGESNLLAGLIQQRDSNTVQGFPGAIHVPFFKQIFSGNDITSDQTEIIMLLTPHIVRTQELTESDLRPIYIGSQQNLGLGGPPPLIAAPEPEPTPPPAPAPTPGAAAPGGLRRVLSRGPAASSCRLRLARLRSQAPLWSSRRQPSRRRVRPPPILRRRLQRRRQRHLQGRPRRQPEPRPHRPASARRRSSSLRLPRCVSAAARTLFQYQ